MRSSQGELISLSNWRLIIGRDRGMAAGVAYFTGRPRPTRMGNAKKALAKTQRREIYHLK